MTTTILIVALVLILCVAAEKCSDRLGLPALILFMFIGMLCGSDGILKIQFADFSQAETICSVCLVFIMFYSGFNTKWSAAKSVAGKAVAMSTLGCTICFAFPGRRGSWWERCCPVRMLPAYLPSCESTS